MNTADMIKIDNELSQRPVEFFGTREQWEALTSAQQAHYRKVNFRGDSGGGGGTGSPNFVGTTAQWNALSAAEKAEFDSSKGVTVNLSDDSEAKVGEWIKYTGSLSNIVFPDTAVEALVIPYDDDSVINRKIYFGGTIFPLNIYKNTANIGQLYSNDNATQRIGNFSWDTDHYRVWIDGASTRSTVEVYYR